MLDYSGEPVKDQRGEPPAYTVTARGDTYHLVVDRHGAPAIRCLRCGMVSYHPADIALRYCGKCHQAHQGLPQKETES